MIKELLETHFGTYYGSTKHVDVECQILKGSVSFTDSKACNECKNHVICDKVVLKCDTSNHEIEAIQFEKFVDNYTHLKKITNKKRCDLLLADENKIVFCEMTCRNAKYMGSYEMKDKESKVGKRQIVREQLENSIALVANVPEINRKIASKNEKIALFAYRVKDKVEKDEFDVKTSLNMNKFGLLQEKILDEPMFSDLDNGFILAEVKYPNVYVW